MVIGTFDSLVIAYDGKDGDELWRYDTGDAKVMTLRSIPDVTGNGVPDVVVGNQCLSLGDEGCGAVFVLEGHI